MSTVTEDRFEEAGKPASPMLRKLAVIAVVENPFVGRYVEDLSPMIEVSSAIGAQMAKRAMEAFGGLTVEGYGKGGIVGLSGEQEHANALLTTTFATPFRDLIGDAPAWISSMTKVAAPGSMIDIPMNATTDVYVRSHYNGMSLVLPDTPMPDEIALIFCVANRGRINARVGGMTFEESKAALRKHPVRMKAMGGVSGSHP
ncbi:MAG: amino acid synthesis family protein [Proteobacteria bacterium]|nr:amino acid synthesis family protein [Pseudomonadota bacterium]